MSRRWECRSSNPTARETTYLHGGRRAPSFRAFKAATRDRCPSCRCSSAQPRIDRVSRLGNHVQPSLFVVRAYSTKGGSSMLRLVTTIAAIGLLLSSTQVQARVNKTGNVPAPTCANGKCKITLNFGNLNYT